MAPMVLATQSHTRTTWKSDGVRVWNVDFESILLKCQNIFI